MLSQLEKQLWLVCFLLGCIASQNQAEDFDKCADAALCYKNYSPVCGSDGHTYSNDCVLEVAICESNGQLTKVSDDTCVACKDVKCQFGATCRSVAGVGRCECEDICGEDVAPVCGTDGITYKNICKLYLNGCKTKRNLDVISYEPCARKKRAIPRQNRGEKRIIFPDD